MCVVHSSPEFMPGIDSVTSNGQLGQTWNHAHKLRTFRKGTCLMPSMLATNNVQMLKLSQLTLEQFKEVFGTWLSYHNSLKLV